MTPQEELQAIKEVKGYIEDTCLSSTDSDLVIEYLIEDITFNGMPSTKESLFEMANWYINMVESNHSDPEEFFV